MTPSTPLFQQAIEALKALQDLPLSAYNITIERVPARTSLTGQPQIRYRLSRVDDNIGTFIHLVTNNGKPDDLILSRPIQLKGWQGPSTINARWTLAGEWCMSVSEVGMVADDEWKPMSNLEGTTHKAPAQATYDAVRATVGQVAQRIHARLSRVDLL